MTSSTCLLRSYRWTHIRVEDVIVLFSFFGIKFKESLSGEGIVNTSYLIRVGKSQTFHTGIKRSTKFFKFLKRRTKSNCRIINFHKDGKNSLGSTCIINNLFSKEDLI